MSTDLRTQFTNQMVIYRLSKPTQQNYLRGINGLTDFHNQPPESLSIEQVQDYLLYLLQEKKLSWGTVNNYTCGIIFFYKHVLNREDIRFKLPPRPRIKKLPSILSEEEVIRLFDAANNLKHRIILKTVYSAGLRLSEAIRLRPEHIESDPSRMMIRVEQGKGKKDRYTILSQNLLPELRAYWRQYQPGEWLFAGQKKNKHIGTTSVHQLYHQAKKKPASSEAGASIH